MLIEPLKRTFSDLFDKTFKKTASDKNSFILYRIVDSNTENGEERYKLQCTYTKAILDLNIQEIVFDLDILHGLHPIQGCFVGIEFAKILKVNASNPQFSEQYQKITTTYAICRACEYSLLYQDRKGFLGFECKQNGEQFLMDPRDIALSKESIEKFDTAHAFQIGVLAGLKFENPKIQHENVHKKTKISYLRLVE